MILTFFFDIASVPQAFERWLHSLHCTGGSLGCCTEPLLYNYLGPSLGSCKLHGSRFEFTP